MQAQVPPHITAAALQALRGDDPPVDQVALDTVKRIAARAGFPESIFGAAPATSPFHARRDGTHPHG